MYGLDLHLSVYQQINRFCIGAYETAEDTTGKLSCALNNICYHEKEYLTVAETIQVLGMTRQGVYKLIYRGDLVAAKLSSRLTIIKRDSIDKMLDGSPYKKRESNEKKTINDFYIRAEIREKFGVKDSWIYKVVAENNVPKTILRGKAYFSKSYIDRLFLARKENPEITEWYSVEDIQSKYGMTFSAIYSLASKIGLPKRKEGPKLRKNTRWHATNCITMSKRIRYYCFPVKLNEERLIFRYTIKTYSQK